MEGILTKLLCWVVAEERGGSRGKVSGFLTIQSPSPECGEARANAGPYCCSHEQGLIVVLSCERARTRSVCSVM